ncbi:hypothetical protein SFRURICE_006429 [Spodoptera frugiperda]|uniref:SFRICE_006278 n=1 Tax=Spodoptera frugiperda TaxID=7108 RepID=A0A2H1VF68_SPOFR|nr:hypothetical protein SFRURICE_006429 [Spodoptera frugiperda]
MATLHYILHRIVHRTGEAKQVASGRRAGGAVAVFGRSRVVARLRTAQRGTRRVLSIDRRNASGATARSQLASQSYLVR